MKTLLIAAIAGATFFTTPTFAKVTSLGGTRVEIVSVDKQKSFILNLTQLGADAIRVTLENADGEILTTEKVQGTDVFRKKFNLSNLAEGTYYLTLTKRNMRTIQPVVVTANAAEVLETAAPTRFAPTFNMTADHKIDVNAMFNGYVPTQVQIFDASDAVVYDKTIKDVFTLHERFNVSALPAGAYTMEISTPTDSYYYSFKK